MKKITLFILISFFVSAVFAQIDTKKTYFYQDSEIASNGDIKLMSKNPVAKFNFSKFELKIINNSKDFVYFLPSYCIFKYEKGEFNPKEKKAIIVRPDDQRSPTLKVEGGNDFLVNQYEFQPGGFYTFSGEGSPISVADFHLPANKNDFQAGDFTVQMLHLKKQTDETAVQFEVTYHGDKIGIVFPSRAVLRTADSTEWANARSSMKPDILEKNEKMKFTLIYQIPGKITDMQFASMDIVWKKVFTESVLEKIEFQGSTIVIDEGKTAEKNKK